MFREEVLSSPSMRPVLVYVGAELNLKVEKELYSEISEWGDMPSCKLWYLAQRNLNNESCKSLRTSKYQKKLRPERQQEDDWSKLTIIWDEEG